MSKNKNDKLNLKKTYYKYISKRHTGQDDIDNNNTQEKKIAWGTHSFINKLSEFTKFVSLILFFMLINSHNLIIFALFL